MKRPFKIGALLGIAACFAFALPNSKTEKIEVVIDAAHGGKDYGAVYGDFMEKEITEAIAKKVKEQVGNKDVEVHFTRLSDEFLELSERVDIINRIKPDLVLSLHTNFSTKENSATSGLEIFIGKNSVAKDKSKAYATALAKQMQEYKFNKSGIEEASFYVLNKVEAPAVMLEMGYLSHEGDRAYLTSTEGQEKLAETIAGFIDGIK